MPLHMIDGVRVPDSFLLPESLSLEAKKKDDSLFDEALELIKKKNALLIAHYYTSDTMQRLCEAAGGFIGDSLEMARVGRDSDKNLLLVAGVRFMGETAKILSPDKTVIMPDLKAECSLDLCCDVEDLKRMKSLHPEATVVAYANTSAQVKAQSDWIVTSSLAVELGKYLTKQGKPILWVPDRHLGSYIAAQSDCEIYCWPGRCIVHDSFEENALDFVKKENPNVEISDENLRKDNNVITRNRENSESFSTNKRNTNIVNNTRLEKPTRVTTKRPTEEKKEEKTITPTRKDNIEKKDNLERKDNKENVIPEREIDKERNKEITPIKIENKEEKINTDSTKKRNYDTEKKTDDKSTNINKDNTRKRNTDVKTNTRKKGTNTKTDSNKRNKNNSSTNRSNTRNRR